jgi:hypothetical protein
MKRALCTAGITLATVLGLTVPAFASASAPAASTPACSNTASTANGGNGNGCGWYSVGTVTTNGGGFDTAVRHDMYDPADEGQPGFSATETINVPATTSGVLPSWTLNADYSAHPVANGAVVAYPDVDDELNNSAGVDPAASSFNTLISTYNTNPDFTSGSDGEVAYDIWSSPGNDPSNHGDELMIWVNSHRDFPPSNEVVATANIGGTDWAIWQQINNGVASSPIDLEQVSTLSGPTGAATYNNNPCNQYTKGCNDDQTYWLQHAKNTDTGTVHLVDIYNYLMSTKDPASGSTYYARGQYIDDIEYGVEICSTGGQNELFQFKGYTLNAKCQSGQACGAS